MAGQEENFLLSRTQYPTDDDTSEEEAEERDDDNDEYDQSKEEVNGASSRGGRRRGWSLGQILDPRSKWLIQEWDRIYLLFCAAGLFVDPLFFYVLSISDASLCLFVDGWLAITVTVLRCMGDLLHVCNMWLKLMMDRRRNAFSGGDSSEVGRQKKKKKKTKKGFLLDLFIILPILQVVLWVALPSIMEKGLTTEVMTVFLIAFIFQYWPKIYHFVRLFRRMQNISGYIFGTIWWGIALNLTAYFVASHASGACWYLLGIQRTSKCLREQCRSGGCDVRVLACKSPIYYGTTKMMSARTRVLWAENWKARTTCLSSPDNYEYGSYEWTVQLFTNNSRLEKILLPIFWALMTLSTFGNIESSTEWLEVVFNIMVLTSGLLLVTLLIGNIKVFLNATTSKKQAMQLRMRNAEWWMRSKGLPLDFRQRVRNYERQRWAATRGVDEQDIILHLPEGLRRDIKYHLCLDLVRQVPLFQHMDDLVLENICDRVKSLIIPKGETIIREGDPVERMIFVVRGHLQSSQVLREGLTSCCMLGPGNFTGDELLSWCLRRPFIERRPPSSSTLVTLESTEAFGLEAEDIKYVTQHFRYTFVNDKVRRSARYYSPAWRTWAAVAIQLAWTRYKHRLTLTSLSFIRPRRPLSRSSSFEEDRVRLYTAILASPKPSQDDYDF